MKRIGLWLATSGCVGLVFAMMLQLASWRQASGIAEAAWGKKAAQTSEKPAAQNPPTTSPGQQASAPSTPSAPSASGALSATASGEEKVAYTFSDDAKMQEFAKLSQQRQGIFVRMSVLQSYFKEEQAALAQLDSKLTAEYHLDLAKNYTLDNQRRVLIERQAPPSAPFQPGPEAATPGAPASQPTPTNPK